VSSCSGTTSDLPNFNEKEWIRDKNGCEKLRESMIVPLEASLDRLKGMSENEILEVLGSPDLNELYKRNQKFYIYHITPSIDCGPSESSTQRFLEIRFSATNRAREIMVKEAGPGPGSSPG
jgi:outer membrane protein assembly factor BamE (lipoprotein component of BamABCDE complex)